MGKEGPTHSPRGFGESLLVYWEISAFPALVFDITHPHFGNIHKAQVVDWLDLAACTDGGSVPWDPGCVSYKKGTWIEEEQTDPLVPVPTDSVMPN